MKPALSEREGFAAFVLRMRSLGMTDQRLMTAFEATSRMAFVSGNLGTLAYGDRMLPIECGEFMEGLDLQARLIKALDLEPAGRVLSIERYRTLVELAQQRHQTLKIENIFIKHADGKLGLTHDGPFDRIVVWAAFESMPRQFVELLSSNGVMIAPIGPVDGKQVVSRLSKIGSRFEREDMMPARFLPLLDGIATAL